MKEEAFDIHTLSVHGGELRPRVHGAVSLPIFQSSTYEMEGGESEYHELRYIRLNNTPNHEALHRKLAQLEGGEAALVAASGMAAITTALLAHLRAGDHLLAQNCLYGGTFDFLSKDLPALGIQVDFVDLDDPGSWEAARRPETRAFYVESMTNPLLQVGDLPAVVDFAREHELLSLIDNTLPSPVNFRPLEIGFDLSLHSCTKYLNGHSDIVAGAVIGGEKLVEKVRHKLDHLGGTLDPHACFLLQRGIKTLPLRVAQQNRSALVLAELLDRHPGVSRVYYPGLAGHPDHGRAHDLFDGYGGLLSFEMEEGLAAAEVLIGRLTLAVHAPSLGGVETLVVLPARSSHAGLTPEERTRAGIAEGLVRLAVGIEGRRDLVRDFEQALETPV